MYFLLYKILPSPSVLCLYSLLAFGSDFLRWGVAFGKPHMPTNHILSFLLTVPSSSPCSSAANSQQLNCLLKPIANIQKALCTRQGALLSTIHNFRCSLQWKNHIQFCSLEIEFRKGTCLALFYSRI